MDERRYYGLDALRGGMMMLGIVLHGAMWYLAAPPPRWPFASDPNTSYLFDVMIVFIHSFRMPTFFLLSGFFTSLLVEKRGVLGTYKNRAARVLAPLLVAVVTVLPITGLLMIDFFLSARFGTHDFIPDRGQLAIFGRELMAKGWPVDQPSVGHLWFLYYLLYFYLLIPVCRWLVKSSLRVEDGVRRFLRSPATLVLFGLYAAATLWPYHGGQVFEEAFVLKPHVPSLIYYGSFFVFGYVFHYYREILQTFSRCLYWYALLALVVFPLSLYASHQELSSASPVLGIHIAAVILNGLCTWTLVFLSVGCALRFFDYESTWILYTSQSSYWVYLVHMIPVSFASWWLLQYDFPAELKYLIVVGVATMACFLTYHYWVQKTWISAFLNWRRFDLQWPWLEVRPDVPKER